VGGAVRDALLGHAHLDWDLATRATPEQVRAVFGRKRTIPVGVEFGTVGVLDADGVMHEVTTFRRDVSTDGRHAEVAFGASLDEDLARRDFTVNAMAYSPLTGVLRDPFGGREDLERKLIRAVGVPAERMREDRLRALRAIRFAARLGFEIEPQTWDSIRDSARHLTRLSAERVKQELEKTMDQARTPSEALGRWKDSGALAALIPELADTSRETLAALDFAAQPGLARRPGRRLNRVAVLFSDLTPPIAVGVATRLRFSKNDAQWIAALVERWRSHGDAMAEALSRGQPDAATTRRWVSAVGRTHLPSFFRVALARWQARSALARNRPGPTARAVQCLYRRCLEVALSEPVDLRDLAIDGDDLRQAGIPPGPGLGKILSVLLEQVILDPTTNTRDRLLEKARHLAEARDIGDGE
jgi:tRNA nucleotidyltransferase (CCA-adding enzyme)